MRSAVLILIMFLSVGITYSCNEKATEDVTTISLRMKGASRENIVYKLDDKSITEEELFQELSALVEQDSGQPVRIDAGPSVSAHFVTHISERVTGLGFTDVELSK
jgi:biopolymer transport protein ExbD